MIAVSRSFIVSRSQRTALQTNIYIPWNCCSRLLACLNQSRASCEVVRKGLVNWDHLRRRTFNGDLLSIFVRVSPPLYIIYVVRRSPTYQLSAQPRQVVELLP